MSRRVGFGLAGFGRMGRFHGENLARAPSIELEDFAAAIRDDRAAAVAGEDALAAFDLAQACDRSFCEGRTGRLRHEEQAQGVVYQPAEAL